MTGTPTEVPVPRRVAVAVRLFTAGSVVGESGWKALSDEDGKLATGKINERFRTHHHELRGNSGFEGLNPALEAHQAMVFHMVGGWRLNRGEMIA